MIKMFFLKLSTRQREVSFYPEIRVFREILFYFLDILQLLEYYTLLIFLLLFDLENKKPIKSSLEKRISRKQTKIMGAEISQTNEQKASNSELGK